MINNGTVPKAQILYVDDDSENLSSFKALFRRDYHVFLASSAAEGLEILRNNDIQILITDQRMPEMAGTELLEMAADEFPKTRRFLLTAYSDFPPLVEAINRGRLQGYFSKPIDGDFIKSRIEEGLKNYYLEAKNKELHEKVQQNELFLNVIFESMPDMVFVKDAGDFRYLRLNKAGETLLGISRDAIFGKTAHECFSAETAEAASKTDREALSKGQGVDIPDEFIETRFKGGRLLHTKKIPVYDQDGSPRYILGVSRDITEQRKLEQKQRKLEERIRHSQKMESIGTLAGGISHDFNNILTSIIGYTELSMMDVSMGRDPSSRLDEIYTAGKRARDLVRQILDFARQSEEKIVPVQIDAVVKEVLNLIRPSIPATIEIRHTIESGLTIMGSATQIHQVFMNLCTNAAQAMEEKGGVLEILASKTNRMEKPGFSVHNGLPDLIRITISDTGYGISPEIRENIFEPYFTTKAPSEGMGMGLATVYGIVKSFGGSISVESEPGRGSVFTLILPSCDEIADVQSEYVEKLPGGHERILVVDDEKAIAKMVGDTLDYLGYNVRVQTSSLEALELFKTAPDQFDLVITDMTMPGLTGDILASKIMEIRPDIPVILCTGYSRKLSEEQAYAMGIKAFLYKPLIMKDLARTLRRVFDTTENHGG